MQKTYKATGTVLGNMWGGGKCAYPAITLHNKDYNALIEEAKQLLETGGLDSGMGYESLTGAILHIDTISENIVDGKVFCNVETNSEFIGELSEKDEEFLMEVYF